MLLGAIFKIGLHIRNTFKQSQLSATAQQQSVLLQLLQQAQHTEFGRYHRFRDLLPLSQSADALIQAYQRQVPAVDYNQMQQQWWHKTLAGQPDVCWKGKIKHFALSSGTTGSPSKYIPVSDEMIKAMRTTSLRMFSCDSAMQLPASFFDGSFLFIGSCTQLSNLEGQPEVWVGDVSGINTGKTPKWFNQFYKPSREITSLPKWEDRLAAIIKNAPNWNIKLIAGLPSWVQMVLEGVISTYNLQHIHQIWPELQVYTSGGVSFKPYKRRFEQLMGKPILYLDTYYTSEGSLGVQTDFQNPQMPIELVLNNGIFFEFVPFDDNNFPNGEISPQAQALHIGQVKTGVDYAVLLSTCSGTWRYLIGDTVRFTNVEKAQILITGRVKQFLSITGEHLSVDNMNQAIEAAEAHFGLEVLEFTVKAVHIEQHFGHRWYIGLRQPCTDEQALGAFIDQYLQKINDDYRTERRDNLLKEISVHCLPAHTFYEWQREQGKSGGQVKFPRVMSEQQYQSWLSFIHQKHS